MRAATRLLLLKLAAVIVPLAAIIGAMHLFLPGLAREREQRLLGERYVIEEGERLRIARPREVRLAPFVAEGLDAFAAAIYERYGEALGLRPVDEKITIRVFASHDDLVRFAGQRMKQDLSHAGGFYDPASWSIALTLRPPRELLAMLFHEATHLLMDRSAVAGPPAWSEWLSEGMAVFFENSALVPGGLRLGGVNRTDAAVVLTFARRGSHVPLRQLVRGGPELFHGKLGSLCYREAGLLVAHLLEGAGRAHREPFLRYYRLEREPGPCPPEELERQLGVALDDLEKEWLAFLQGIVR